MSGHPILRKRLSLQAVEVDPEQHEGYQRAIAGLKPGDRVVIHPADDLKEGERIRTDNEQHTRL